MGNILFSPGVVWTHYVVPALTTETAVVVFPGPTSPGKLEDRDGESGSARLASAADCASVSSTFFNTSRIRLIILWFSPSGCACGFSNKIGLGDVGTKFPGSWGCTASVSSIEFSFGLVLRKNPINLSLLRILSVGASLGPPTMRIPCWCHHCIQTILKLAKPCLFIFLFYFSSLFRQVS